MGVQTGFINSNNIDIGNTLVDKSYLIDRYPELANQFKQAGLWTWGYNFDGQLGENTTTFDRKSPVQTVSFGTNWKEITIGGSGGAPPAGCAVASIKTDGTLWTWGLNSSGQLGTNNTLARSSPGQTISGGTNWKNLPDVLLGTFMGAIKTDGTLWTWGTNANGQLGTNTNTARSSPGQTVSNTTNWKQLAVGTVSSAAIKTDGTLWTWGLNTDGQLGTNTNIARSSPGQTISGGTNWKNVSGGNLGFMCLKTDGTLWTWGSNVNGELGTNTTLSRSSPGQTISGGTNWKEISHGGTTSGSVKTDGTLWMWGNNTNGKLGDSTTLSRSSPVQTISGGTNWKSISTGSFGTSAALKTDGTLWMWGAGLSGVRGDELTSDRSSPVQTINNSTNWKKVVVGDLNSGTTIAIRDDSADIFGDYI